MAKETSQEQLANEQQITSEKRKQLDVAKQLDALKDKSRQIENDILSRVEQHRDVTFSLTGDAKKYNSMSMDALKIIKSKVKADGSLAEVYKDQLSKVKQINNKNVSMLSLGKMFLDSRKKANEAEKKGHVHIASQQKNLGNMAIARGKMLVQEKAGNFLQKSNLTIMGAVLGVFNFLLKSATQFDSGLNSIGKRFGSLPELGEEFNTGLINAGASVVDIGASVEDVINVTGGLTSEFGLSLDEAKDISAQVVDTAKATGLANQQAAKLTGIFMKVSGLSADQAEHLIESTRQLATQNRVAPVAVLEDLAAAAEQVAIFTKDGGENIRNAAVQARAMGMSFGDVASSAANVLNIESSIQDVMQGNVLAGTNINLNRLRELGFAGNLEGFAKEQIRLAKQLAREGRDDFFSRQAQAKMLGTSVQHLMQMRNATIQIKKIKPFEDLSGADAQGRITDIVNQLKKIAAIALNTVGPAINNALGAFTERLKDGDLMGRIESSFLVLQSAVTKAFAPENIESFLQIADRLGEVIHELITAFEKFGGVEGISQRIKEEVNDAKSIMTEPIEEAKDYGTGALIGGGLGLGAAAFAGMKSGGALGTLFGGPVGTLLGGLIGAGLGIGTVALGKYVFGDDNPSSMNDGVVSPGGIKYMSGPAGSFQLNPKDSVLATTNSIKVNEFAQGNVSVGGDGAVVKAIDNLTNMVMRGIPIYGEASGNAIKFATDSGYVGGSPSYENLVTGKR